jgi:hypothetical protein
MTITVNLPADLQDSLLAHAAASGLNLEDEILTLLRDTMILHNSDKRSPPTLQRLEPGVFPDETLADDFSYQSVPFPLIGTVSSDLKLDGRLIPSTLPVSE